MTELRDRLQAALGNTYVIERELGRGGMATVFLARDSKHARPVAIKVLRPDVAAALGPERFLHEIEIAARLTHPHILPLHDSGEMEGLLYYIMPYVEGESLRQRLARERQLPLEDAIQIAKQVAAALAYAHSLGVVHRDIKPENILLEGGEAVVADFGIARAITAAGGDRLTETGLAVGTPAYMSPEQGSGSAELDGRSDLYSLGCVLYEMLAGEPPYTGPNPQAILARRLTDPVRSLRTVRDTVSRPLELAINRALARVPADRFATAAQFADALTASASEDSTAEEAPPPRRRTLAALAGAAGLLGLAALAVTVWRGRGTTALDPNVVAVLPFRVSGADPALAYLREGMPELLAVKLTGEGGPRAVDPSVALHAWRRAGGTGSTDLQGDAAFGMARQVGAGRLIQGAIIGSPVRLTLSASLARLPGGSASIPVSVEGPLDSLSSLVDRLTAILLADEAGQTSRLADLATTSLPALRTYLDGQAAYRRGRFAEAVERFREALQLDSSFALAGLSLSSAAAWTSGEGQLGLRLAWPERARLNPRDRALLLAEAGPHYPAPSSRRELLAAWEQAVIALPDRPEAWYGLGDMLFHFGRELGIPHSWNRAAEAFRRCLALDSTLAGPTEHLVEMAQIDGDTATARRLATNVIAADSVSEIADYMRWHAALARGDSAALVRMRERYGRMTDQSLIRIQLFAEEMGVRAGDAEYTGTFRGAGGAWAMVYQVTRMFLGLNLGRPGEALAAAQELRSSTDSGWGLRYLVTGALYGGGDTTTAAQAARDLARTAEGPPARTASGREEQFDNLCTLAQWRLWHHQLASVDRAISGLSSVATPADSIKTVIHARWCVILLQAGVATLRKAPDASAALDRLDSILLTSPLPAWDVFLKDRYANLVAARLHEAQEDPARALAAVRRRIFYWTAPDYLAAYLREEGRLAALTGDRTGAIKAYQHYLALRLNPESSVKPEVDRVKAELATLVGEKQ